MFAGSKAVGEQSFLMGCSTIFALRRAIDSIRNDQGENPMPFYKLGLLHFVAFFHVASLFSAGVDNKKVGVDNEKALELTNSTVFHRGRQ